MPFFRSNQPIEAYFWSLYCAEKLSHSVHTESCLSTVLEPVARAHFVRFLPCFKSAYSNEIQYHREEYSK